MKHKNTICSQALQKGINAPRKDKNNEKEYVRTKEKKGELKMVVFFSYYCFQRKVVLVSIKKIF